MPAIGIAAGLRGQTALRFDFRAVLDALMAGQDPRSPLAQAIGAKGYHDKPTGVYTS